ncbi:unnamed protein product, partial [Ectocarpus fasciculatus]
AVVSAASRGIGLEFTRQLLARPDTRVFAVTRSNSPSKGLAPLLEQYGSRLTIVPNVDLTDPSSIAAGVDMISGACKGSSGPPIDLLINCAGILGDNSESMPGPEKSIFKVDPQWLERTMRVNFMSHVLMTQGIAPLMKRTVKKNTTADSISIAKIINISARVGSIEDNALGGWLSYRCSKAALNQFTKTAALELKRSHCAVISLHPGTTNTDLSTPFQKNLPVGQLMSPEDACSKMMAVIDGIRLDDTGGFFAYNGKPIAW